MGILDRLKQIGATRKGTAEPLGRRLSTIRDKLEELERKGDLGSKKWMALLDEWKMILGTIADRNVKGRDLEKRGDVERAIRLYEQNIAEEVDTDAPYTRLAIIYRRQKRFDDEIRVLEKGIETLTKFGCDTSGWEERLAKAKQIRDKERTPRA